MRKRIWFDEIASLEGLPLYILIMVIIAAVSLAAILGFMVWTSPTLGWLYYDKLTIGGVGNSSAVVCDDVRDDGTHYYKGSSRPDPSGTGTLKPEPGYSTYVTVHAVDKNGKGMPGVKIHAKGAGINVVETTVANGTVRISLEGCYLPPGVDNIDIEIVGTYPGTFGEQKVTSSLPVIAK